MSSPAGTPTKKRPAATESATPAKKMQLALAPAAAGADLSSLDSIDAILRHMDKLEPSQGYFDRQKDSKGGCSGTRGKLRKLAKRDPSLPGIAHWEKTGKWAPPDQSTLDALIALLKKEVFSKK